MDNDALRLFLHLSRTLHFGRTSRECHVSPSALTRTIQKLEQELGYSLFERDKRSVELTTEGVQFQSYASETLERFETLKRSLGKSDDKLSGSISLFCSVTACYSFLPRLFSEFREAYPEIHIELETGDAVDALGRLERGRADIVVASIPERMPPRLPFKVITHSPLHFIAPLASCAVSRDVERKSIRWSRIPMVLPTSGLARQSVDRWFKNQCVSPNVYSEVSGNEAVLSLVSLGCGVGVVPDLVIEKSPLSANVRRVEVTPKLPDFKVAVCTLPQNLQSKLIQAFWRTFS